MITATVDTKFEFQKIRKKMKYVSNRALALCGLDLMEVARRMIKSRPAKGKKAAYSKPGEPPKTASNNISYQYAGDKSAIQIEGKAGWYAYGEAGKIQENYKWLPIRLSEVRGKVVPLARPGQFISEKKANQFKKLKIAVRSFKNKVQVLKNSIGFKADEQNNIVYVGVLFSKAVDLGRIHERGGIGPAFRARGIKYPKRPFMVPALKKTIETRGMRKHFQNVFAKYP